MSSRASSRRKVARTSPWAACRAEIAAGSSQRPRAVSTRALRAVRGVRISWAILSLTSRCATSRRSTRSRVSLTWSARESSSSLRRVTPARARKSPSRAASKTALRPATRPRRRRAAKSPIKKADVTIRITAIRNSSRDVPQGRVAQAHGAPDRQFQAAPELCHAGQHPVLAHHQDAGLGLVGMQFGHCAAWPISALPSLSSNM